MGIPDRTDSREEIEASSELSDGSSVGKLTAEDRSVVTCGAGTGTGSASTYPTRVKRRTFF